MSDVVDSAKRSWMMSGIKGKNTRPELQIRRYLHRLGFRYSLHRQDLPGRPDLTMTRYRAVIFVHGCFWHAHASCRFAKVPATRPDFWRQKLQQNCDRDARQVRQLLELGWRVAVVWECALRRSPEITLAGLSEFLRDDQHYAEFSWNQEPRIE